MDTDWWGMLPLVALLADICLGDPQRLWHPVQGVGWLAVRVEAYFRPRGASKLHGALGVLWVSTITAGVVWFGIVIPVFGAIVALYFAYAGLALGSLLAQIRTAAQLVCSGSLEEARRAVGMLVSRDTSAMTTPELYRALAESLSENSNDGFVAPFFFLVVGGPVVLWVYKSVSTLDSMWGYKNVRWREYGFTAARLDDTCAYIPARLTALCMLCSARLLGMPAARDMCTVWRRVADDAACMDSPNAGWPMAMGAWLLSREMGGPTVYDGVIVQKPRLGPVSNGWEAQDIVGLLRLVRISCVLAGGVLWLTMGLIKIVF